MFQDAASVPRDSTLRADVVIIGAGAAGITLARALAATSLQVIVLESGGLDVDPKTDDLQNGLSTGAPYPLPFARLRYFGGTTNHWGGWCRPLDSWVFSHRPWVDSQGWPIDLETLSPYYAKAADVVELRPDPAGWQWDWPYWQRQLQPSGGPLFVDNETVTSAMFRFSPPTRFGTRYRADLEAAPRVQTLLHANALELKTDDDAKHVTGVRVGTLGGNRFTVEGRAVVVAVGGLEVPRLLLLSDGARPKGLGNDHDLVGRYFMDHIEGSMGTAELNASPESYLGGRFSLFNSLRAMLTLTPETMQREELLSMGVSIDAGDGGVARFADARTGVTAQRVGAVRRAVAGGGSHHFDVLVRAEPKPSRSSRVVLADQRDGLGQRRLELQYAKAGKDAESIRRTLEIVGLELGRAGVGRLRIDMRDNARSKEFLTVGCHLMGTTRMAADPRDGVVDADLKVHGLDNLYIASSSVFPTVGFSNPTLTIVALTLRLMDHLVTSLT